MIKKNMKLIIGFVIGLILTTGGVYALNTINASSISIDKTSMTNIPESNLQSALDYLYQKSDQYILTIIPVLDGTIDSSNIIRTNIKDDSEYYSDYGYYSYQIITDDIQGYSFRCYSYDSEGMNCSYHKNSFIAYMDRDKGRTLYAIYESETTEHNDTPFITLETMNIVSTSNDYLSVTFLKYIPANYENIETGVLYGVKNAMPVLDGADVYKYTANIDSGTLSLRNKVSSRDIRLYYRGYMKLRNKTTNEEEIFYSSVYSTSYNSFLNNSNL